MLYGSYLQKQLPIFSICLILKSIFFLFSALVSPTHLIVNVESQRFYNVKERFIYWDFFRVWSICVEIGAMKVLFHDFFIYSIFQYDILDLLKFFFYSFILTHMQS